MMKNRAIHVIDIENLAGRGMLTIESARGAAARYRNAVELNAGDHLIVASSSGNAFAAAFAFPEARRLWRDGRNGADFALLDVLETEHVDVRFDHLFIGSGDGIFAGTAARLASSMHVSAVSLPGHAAARLRLACHETLYLGTTRTDKRSAA